MSVDLTSTVRTGWLLAASRRTAGSVATLDLPVNTAAGPAALGVDDRGDHHLLLPVGGDHPAVQDGRSAHVRVDTRPLVVAGRQRRYVDIVCHRSDLFGTFDEMIVALLQAVAERPDQVGDIVTRTLQQWRDLLRSTHGVLGERELRGLLGELYVLQLIADARLVGVVDQVWTGPDQAVHDFAVQKRRIEVKTVGARDVTVTIHGLDQLHPQRDCELVLVVVRLEADPDGRCLPELVDTLLDTIRDRAGVRRQLAKAGYVEAEADRYRDRRYVVSQTYAWRIGQSFPRIDVESFTTAVPQQVVDVQYTLDLSGMTPYAATDDAAVRLIKGQDIS